MKTPMKKVKAIASTAAMLLLASTGAHAGTTGTEFQPLFNWANGEVTGYLGKTISVAAVAIGGMMSVARVNPIPVLSGIGFATFLNYTPTIITSILSATV